MAGTITHLVIADRLLSVMPNNVRGRIKNLPLYYCGNLAPDAIMARSDYRREMKVHTHFKDNIPEDKLAVPENFAMYRGRLEEFAGRFLVEGNPEYELYFGYVIHMMADEIFVLTVRDRHVELLKKSTDNPDYECYFTQFGHDVDLNDWRLLTEYSFSCDILKAIQAETQYEIEGYITCNELQKSKRFIIEKNFKKEHPQECPKILIYEENLDYIEDSVRRIASALSTRVL